MKNLKATVSDFEGQYSAYYVRTRDGMAFKGPDYGRAVDIGESMSYALTTDEIQALYGDTLALQLRNQVDGRVWPGSIALMKHPLHLVSLALSFNQVSGLMARTAETGQDPVLQAFEKAAQKNGGLEPGDLFFIIPSLALPETTNEKEIAMDATDEEAIKHFSNNPGHVIVSVEHASELLNDAHTFALIGEKREPGFVRANKFHLAGLYMGRPDFVRSLPIPVQDRAPISQITSELRRILG